MQKQDPGEVAELYLNSAFSAQAANPPTSDPKAAGGYEANLTERALLSIPCSLCEIAHRQQFVVERLDELIATSKAKR